MEAADEDNARHSVESVTGEGAPSVRDWERDGEMSTRRWRRAAGRTWRKTGTEAGSAALCGSILILLQSPPQAFDSASPPQLRGRWPRARCPLRRGQIVFCLRSLLSRTVYLLQAPRKTRHPSSSRTSFSPHPFPPHPVVDIPALPDVCCGVLFVFVLRLPLSAHANMRVTHLPSHSLDPPARAGSPTSSPPAASLQYTANDAAIPP